MKGELYIIFSLKIFILQNPSKCAERYMDALLYLLFSHVLGAQHKPLAPLRFRECYQASHRNLMKPNDHPDFVIAYPKNLH